jgi:hypothetical protein
VLFFTHENFGWSLAKFGLQLLHLANLITDILYIALVPFYGGIMLGLSIFFVLVPIIFCFIGAIKYKQAGAFFTNYLNLSHTTFDPRDK